MKNLYMQKVHLFGDAFSPSSPIVSKASLAGRNDQISRIIDAVIERGQHAILYGERGVGKTSLANTFNEFLVDSPVLKAKINCNRDDNFTSIWRKIGDKIAITIDGRAIGFVAEKKHKVIRLSNVFRDEDLTPSRIEAFLEQIPSVYVLIFDEFDTVKDPQTRSQFADLIKDLSDNAPYITILLVGIAESVGELIGEHESLGRCLKQVKMPIMSPGEVNEILDKGLTVLGMDMEDSVRIAIIKLSQGLPHYAHLLGKYACINSLKDGSLKVLEPHFRAAINEAIENTNENIRRAYQQATLSSKQSTRFPEVLSACAIAEEDDYGCFRTRDIITAYKRITGENIISQTITYNLGKLCKDEKGNALQKLGKGMNVKYKFRNPLLKVFLKLKLFDRNRSDLLL